MFNFYLHLDSFHKLLMYIPYINKLISFLNKGYSKK